LSLFNKAKRQYQAWLGLEVGSDQAVLARLEYHPSHRGWHCHIKKGELNEVGWGVVKHSAFRERAAICKKANETGDLQSVTDMDAISIACRVFDVRATVETDELFK
jgi:hypothetical protein